jgi:hypothetical protein
VLLADAGADVTTELDVGTLLLTAVGVALAQATNEIVLSIITKRYIHFPFIHYLLRLSNLVNEYRGSI